MTDRAQEIAQDILCTDRDISEVMERHEEEDLALCSELSEYALRCTECGYWAVPEEMDTTYGDCLCGECLDRCLDQGG